MSSDKEKIVEILNQDRADELAAIVQYMCHHYEADGMESVSLSQLFKEAAIDEMKHAEKLAERIVYLGGIPTKKPSEIKSGGDLRKMISDDLAGENAAIKKYKEHIKICLDFGDITTRRILEEILATEEDHANNWESALSVRKKN